MQILQARRVQRYYSGCCLVKMSQTVSARIFAVKTTGGQEKTVAKFVGDRLEQRKHEGKKDSQVYSILGTRSAEELRFL